MIAATATARNVLAMIVCVCHRISHREIEHHAAACDSFDELQMCTGVATGCGRCGDCARAVFDDARSAAPCGPQVSAVIRLSAVMA
jgi:bacterioferritin-associated ferredoxin